MFLLVIGFYFIFKIYYDCDIYCGYLFYYFGYGVVVFEVIIDIFIGEYCVLCIDIFYDVGELFNFVIDLG